MKKIFFILFTLVAFIGYGQSPLTDVNGKVITSATGDILVQEEDPNNFEYTPNAEWIPVNGVKDGEIWILAFDGGASNLFTITCTTSSGEWQMDIYGGADGKTLLRTYDTTSNVALSHTLVSGTGKYSYTSGYYTYKIVIKPKTVGSDILSIYSEADNTPYKIINCGAKYLSSISFINSENLIYANTYHCEVVTTRYAFDYCTSLEVCTMAKYMNELLAFGQYGNSWAFVYSGFRECINLYKVTMPIEMRKLIYFGNYVNNSDGSGAFDGCVNLTSIILPVRLDALVYFGGWARDWYWSRGSGAFYGCTKLKTITMNSYLPSLKYWTGNYGDYIYVGAISNCTSLENIVGNPIYSTNNVLFNSIGLKALTTFNQPTLRCSSFTLTGVSNADRSNVNYIQIDWANSQFTGDIDIRYNNLSATELNRIFTELPTVVVSRTIYVASNVGSATCDPTIATAKNWIVVTS